MREALLLTVVMVTAGLAGCIGDSDPASVDEAAPSATNDAPEARLDPVPGPLTFEDCIEHAGAFPVQGSAYEDRLPDGFSLAPYFALADVPAASEETAMVTVASWECQGPGGGPTTHYANLKLSVIPPERFQAEDVDGYSIGLVGFTTNGTFADAFQDWGLGSYQEAEIQRNWTDSAMASKARTQAVSDVAEIDFATSVEGERGSVEGSVLRTFHVEERRVTGAVDITVTGSESTLTDPSEGSAGGAVLHAAPGLHPAPATTGLSAHFWNFGQTYEDANLALDREAS